MKWRCPRGSRTLNNPVPFHGLELSPGSLQFVTTQPPEPRSDGRPRGLDVMNHIVVNGRQCSLGVDHVRK
jgi:hypothetical protein